MGDRKGSISVNIRFPPDLLERLRARASQLGRPYQTVLKDALEAYLAIDQVPNQVALTLPPVSEVPPPTVEPIITQVATMSSISQDEFDWDQINAQMK